MNFAEHIHDEILEKTHEENPQAQQSNKCLYNITCPSCGANEARIYFDNPEFIRCHRENHCGAVSAAVFSTQKLFRLKVQSKK